MNKDLEITEYTEKMKLIKLSESSRARIEQELLAYARFHQVSDSVRVDEVSRSIEQVPPRTSFVTQIRNLNKKSMTAAILIVMLMVGGGTSFAAEGALPGDFLYPVKVEVNESIKSALAISADAEAELQAKLLAERVSEVEMLQARGDISDEQSLAIAARVKAQVADAEEVFTKSTEAVAATSRAEARVSVEQYNSLFATESTLLVDVDSLFSSDTAFGSELQTEPIDTGYIISSTEFRITSLTNTITEAGANISASVKADLTAKLDSATELLVTARAQSGMQAQNTAIAASGLVGEVEAKMSLLGSVDIDTDTGAIIGIDFSESQSEEVDQSDDAESSDTIDVELETSIDGAAGGGVSGSIQSSANLGL